MTNNHTAPTALTEEMVRNWLLEKVASRLGTEPSQVSPDTYFDDFGLDSTEALILAGELERWLGFELETTALWYHPTIGELSAHIVSEHSRAQARS
jgi:acyl carrier protein